MTIRMLKPWNGYQPDQILSFSTAEETRLVGLGLADYDLDGAADALELVKAQRTLTGGIDTFSVNSRPFNVAGLKARRMVFIGDSLSAGGTLNSPQASISQGRPWWFNTTSITLTNLGAGSWLVAGFVNGLAPSGAAGTLRTDGNGYLQWAYTADSYGALVDCRAGGFFELQSGTSAYSIYVYVRGGTAFPASVGTGAVTTSGLPAIGDYNLLGFSTFVAGMVGDLFTNYDTYAIAGATSSDVLLFADQAVASGGDAACVLVGVNDAPASAANAQSSITNIKAVIQKALAKFGRVYVGDMFPYTAASATIQKYMALVSLEIERYCATYRNVRFWTAYDRLITANALPTANKTGCFHTDNLHLMPYGAYVAAKPLVDMILQDFPTYKHRRCGNDAYDSTLTTGAWNSNPTLRGTAGTVTGGVGITGTAPDSWTLNRSGSTQTCTTSFVAAPDGGIDFFTMALASATAGDYHELSQSVTVPAGINAGDYFQITGEVSIGAMTGNGVSTFQMQANGNGNVQASYLFQTGRNVATFNTENPVLQFKSQPQKLISGTTSFTMRMRVGAAASATGTVGVREFRIEKVPAPTY